MNHSAKLGCSSQTMLAEQQLCFPLTQSKSPEEGPRAEWVWATLLARLDLPACFLHGHNVKHISLDHGVPGCPDCAGNS